MRHQRRAVSLVSTSTSSSARGLGGSGLRFRPSSTASISRVELKLIRRAAVVLGVAALAACGSGTSRRDAPAAEHAAASAPLRAVPWTVVWACRRLQRQARFPVLCPKVLPQPTLGTFPEQPPSPVGVERLYGGAHGAPSGLSIGYGVPPYAGGSPPPGAAVLRPRPGENGPCCYLHFTIERIPGAG